MMVKNVIEYLIKRRIPLNYQEATAATDLPSFNIRPIADAAPGHHGQLTPVNTANKTHSFATFFAITELDNIIEIINVNKDFFILINFYL